MLTQDDLTHIVVVTDADKDNVRALCGFDRRRRSGTFKLAAPLRGPGRRTIIDNHIMAAF